MRNIRTRSVWIFRRVGRGPSAVAADDDGRADRGRGGRVGRGRLHRRGGGPPPLPPMAAVGPAGVGGVGSGGGGSTGGVGFPGGAEDGGLVPGGGEVGGGVFVALLPPAEGAGVGGLDALGGAGAFAVLD